MNVSNVVLIAVDSLRYDTAHAEMPTLRQLGRDHIGCHQYHTAGPGTPSSTAALIQSRQPVEHDGQGMELPASRQTLAEQLADAGVATAGWHANGFLTDTFGFPRGFDEWTDFDAHNEDGESDSLRARLGDLVDRLGVRTPAERVFEALIQSGLADADPQTDMETFVNAGLSWIGGERDEKQFAYLHPMDVHMPYIPPAEYRTQDVGDLYNIWSTLTNEPASLSDDEVATARRAYRNEARYVDDQLARLVDSLKDRDLWDDTALIITADHGELFRDRETPTSHALKHQNYLCEELTHVPFVLAGGGIPEMTITEPVSAVDMAPTVARLADIEPAEEWSGCPIWSQDVVDRNAVVSSTMHSHGRGVEVIPDELHIAVRTPETSVLWWANEKDTEYYTRTTAGEVRVDAEQITAEREHEIRRDIKERSDKVRQDSKVGGDVTERLRDLGYVEEGDV